MYVIEQHLIDLYVLDVFIRKQQHQKDDLLQTLCEEAVCLCIMLQL